MIYREQKFTFGSAPSYTAMNQKQLPQMKIAGLDICCWTVQALKRELQCFCYLHLNFNGILWIYVFFHVSIQI